MRNYRLTYSFLLIFSISACEQQYIEDNQQGKSIGEKKINDALTDSTGNYFVDNKRIIIKNEETAISVAEPILFSNYGKENIINQRPYRTSNVEDYWIIEGTLAEDYLGGTFLIIIDSRNGEIIKITHGK